MITNTRTTNMRWKFWKKDKDEELEPFPVQFEQTQELIRSIRQEVPGDFLTYWVCDRYSMMHDDPLVIRMILPEEVQSKHLYTFVRSFGGSGEAALRAIHMLRRKYDHLTTLVPLECSSAATMLAIGADKIQMGALAYLSAIDISFSHELAPKNALGQPSMLSQDEVSRVIKLWEQKRNTSDKNPYESLYEHIHPLIFAQEDRVRSLSTRITNEILSYHMKDRVKAGMISDYLNSGYPAHGYPIAFKEAKRIGLPVEPLPTSLDHLLIQLNSLYSEMAQPVSKHGYTERHIRRIESIVEIASVQYYYQRDIQYEFNHYLKSWQMKKNESGWRKVEYGEEGEELVTTRIYLN